MVNNDLDEAEPHDLDEKTFYGKVRSFSFWFEAVEGYLEGRPYGYDPETVEEELDESRRQRLITTLCNYCVGEAAALEGASGMVRLAPNHNSRIFLATQVADEARHLEVFLHRIGELGIDDPELEVRQRAHPSIVAFKHRLLELVDSGDWDASVFTLNVLLETLEFTVFGHHARVADPITSQVLDGVVSDERRHLGFGENTLGHHLMNHPGDRARLEQIKSHLDALVMGAFEGAYDDLGLLRDQRPRLGQDYIEAIERLGLL